MAEVMDREYLERRVCKLESETQALKHTINALRGELSARDKVIDELDAFVQITDKGLATLAEAFHNPKLIIADMQKSIEDEKWMGEPIHENDIMHAAIVDTIRHMTYLGTALKMNRGTLLLLNRFAIELEELPPSLTDDLMFQISHEKKWYPHGHKYKGGGKSRKALRANFMCWVAACYDYLVTRGPKQIEATKEEKTKALKKVAEACGYGIETGTKRVLKIHSEVNSPDWLFGAAYDEALSTLEKMPAATPEFNVTSALKSLRDDVV